MIQKRSHARTIDKLVWKGGRGREEPFLERFSPPRIQNRKFNIVFVIEM